jgi:hypothetical protein
LRNFRLCLLYIKAGRQRINSFYNLGRQLALQKAACIFFRHNNGHAGVYILHLFVCGSSEYDESVFLLPCRIKAIIKACKIKEVLRFGLYDIFRLAFFNALPFKKAGARHETFPVRYVSPEHINIENRLAARVYYQLFCLAFRKSPRHNTGFIAGVCLSKYCGSIAGAYDASFNALGGVVTQAVVVTLIACTIGAALAVALDVAIPAGGIPFSISVRRILSSVIYLLVAAVIGCAFSLRRVLRIDPASAIGSA